MQSEKMTCIIRLIKFECKPNVNGLRYVTRAWRRAGIAKHTRNHQAPAQSPSTRATANHKRKRQAHLHERLIRVVQLGAREQRVGQLLAVEFVQPARDVGRRGAHHARLHKAQ